MFDKFWKQFLIEAEETFRVPDGEQQLTGDEAYIKSLGFHINKTLGSGMDGKVYEVENKNTGQRMALKITPSWGEGNADREQENYEFVRNNRDSFGQYAKYLPVVYSSNLVDIPYKNQPIDGKKGKAAVITMELLEPLPKEFLRSIFNLTRNTGPEDQRINKMRDNRLFSDEKLIKRLLSMAIDFLQDDVKRNFTPEDREKIISDTINEFYSSDTTDKLKSMTQTPQERSIMTKQATVLKHIFGDKVFEKRLEKEQDPRIKQIYLDNQEIDKKYFRSQFTQAYARPLLSGGIGLKDTSGLKGIDYGSEAGSEVSDVFPETENLRNAMKYFFRQGRLQSFDVHSANVMMRPSTKDVVIVDLGRFNLLKLPPVPPQRALPPVPQPKRSIPPVPKPRRSIPPPPKPKSAASTFVEGKRRMTENMKKQVASCIVFDNKDRILIIKRSKTDDWKPGWWDIPGGHMEEGEIPVEGAIRETDEESGLTVRNLVQVETKQFPDIIKHFFATRDYDGEVYFRPNHETGEIEHDEYKWVSIEQLKDIQNSVVPLSIVKKASHLV
jgi:8-oxo-dGTP pyrophosphatase MutT (NUDIX family)/vacuolar-type H+-ATPase subunit E/Vma4